MTCCDSALLKHGSRLQICGPIGAFCDANLAAPIAKVAMIMTLPATVSGYDSDGASHQVSIPAHSRVDRGSVQNVLKQVTQ